MVRTPIQACPAECGAAVVALVLAGEGSRLFDATPWTLEAAQRSPGARPFVLTRAGDEGGIHAMPAPDGTRSDCKVMLLHTCVRHAKRMH